MRPPNEERFPYPETIGYGTAIGYIDDTEKFVEERQRLADEAGMSLDDLHTYASCHIQGPLWKRMGENPSLIPVPPQKYLLPLIQYQRLHNAFVSAQKGGGYVR